MRRSGRLCGPLVAATVVIHLTFGLVMGWESVVDIVQGGIDGASEVSPAGESWFWFLVAGLPMLLVGQLVTRLYARTSEVPGFLGWYLLLFAGLVYFMPASGFWIFLPQAALAFYASHAIRPASTTSPEAVSDGASR